jgi:transposase
VLRVLHDAGVEARRQPVGDALIARVIELYESGLSIRQVAAKVGVPKTSSEKGVSSAVYESDITGLVSQPPLRRHEPPAA